MDVVFPLFGIDALNASPGAIFTGGERLESLWPESMEGLFEHYLRRNRIYLIGIIQQGEISLFVTFSFWRLNCKYSGIL